LAAFRIHPSDVGALAVKGRRERDAGNVRTHTLTVARPAVDRTSEWTTRFVQRSLREASNNGDVPVRPPIPGHFPTAGSPIVRLGIVPLLVIASLVIPAVASAGSNCGTSNGQTLCVTAGSSLSGDAKVTVTISPNTGVVIATWLPSNGPSTQLIESFAPSPATNDYSFVWPTGKYVDASGTLRVQAGSTAASPVDVAVTLSNGNTTNIQHTPNDWASHLPGAWTAPSDPTIIAVGDGPSNEVTSNAVAARIASLHPPLFLFLGDVYETGSFTEFRNHYGVSSLDSPGSATLWGATAHVTQPTIGNHENANVSAFVDYWHQRPLFTKFTFGGALFLDMNAKKSLMPGSKQYRFIESAVTDPAAPRCIVAYWHRPAVKNNTQVIATLSQAWALLANGGVDLLLVGDQHHMVEDKPLDANFTAGTPKAHLVQLVAGSGGHQLAGVSKTQPGKRIAWSRGKTAGYLALTLNGAAGGNAATSIRWRFRDVNGTSLRSRSVVC
jgi:hypothetical protein